MFRSSIPSSSGSSLFIFLSKLLILKNIKIFKKYYQSIVVMWQHMFIMSVMRTVWRRELAHTLLCKIISYWYIFITSATHNHFFNI
jgi:hypothetical protein